MSDWNPCRSCGHLGVSHALDGLCLMCHCCDYKHANDCTCPDCRSAAMGGGR